MGFMCILEVKAIVRKVLENMNWVIFCTERIRME